eukprot:TRINITY_DN1482_c0_g1_i1.p1 TRINITY_DN1482_c0_g1~~TRINITY_DN1482_c0_g1_i1.p1  ORF type:complete len:319 (-),score=73.46 TRINITY_DN1482_c0_g1_i1:784-1740(-)
MQKTMPIVVNALVASLALFSCAMVAGSKLIYGVDYNPRRDWYLCPTVDQVVEDLNLVSSYTDRIRLYSFTDCNQTETVLQAIAQSGASFKLLLGMWTTNDTSLFDAEFAMMQHVFAKYPQQLANIEVLTVGSETIWRGEQTVVNVSANILTVKNYLETINASQIPVTLADVAANYMKYPDLVHAVDIVFVNKFSFWESQLNFFSVWEMMSGLSQVQKLSQGKPFMVSETGWPDAGSPYYLAFPSDANAAYYLQNWVCSANSKGMKYMYFAAFDDGWKQPWQMGPQGVEKHWGLFNFNRTAKPGRLDFSCKGASVVHLS